MGDYLNVGQTWGEEGTGVKIGRVVRGGYGDRTHAGRGREAGGGVFDYNAFCGGAAEAGGGEQVGFGVRLAVDDVFRRYQNLGRREAAVLKDDRHNDPEAEGDNGPGVGRQAVEERGGAIDRHDAKQECTWRTH